MNKPDWAQRLQNTFQKRYDAGYKDGYDEGWKEGGLVGISVGQQREREIILSIFEDLNKRQLTKTDFADLFVHMVDGQ